MHACITRATHVRVDLPLPVAPTNAAVLPPGTMKETDLSTVGLGAVRSYEKLTPSYSTEPELTTSSLQPSCAGRGSKGACVCQIQWQWQVLAKRSSSVRYKLKKGRSLLPTLVIVGHRH